MKKSPSLLQLYGGYFKVVHFVHLGSTFVLLYRQLHHIKHKQ